MTRAEQIRAMAYWRQVSDAAGARARSIRDALDAEARAQLDAEGTAPTWRDPDLGPVTLPLTRPAAELADPAALLAYVAEHHSTEVEIVTRVRPAFAAALLGRARLDAEGTVRDSETGRPLPGVRWRLGGEPSGPVRLAITKAAAAALRARADADLSALLPDSREDTTP